MASAIDQPAAGPGASPPPASPCGVRASLDAARRWEPAIDAWVYLDHAAADIGRETLAAGPLAGAAFGVKDVIDVLDMPTAFGRTDIGSGRIAAADADVVAALRAAGAVPIGKTRSTAYAFIDPTTTRNPYDLSRSPGGSSSGSGAVVGAGVTPFALGTQTAGSLCRPAAYCGAYAYKPSLGAMPTTGMAPLSRSFDAIGVIAASHAWLERVYAVLADAFHLGAMRQCTTPLKIAALTTPEQAPEAGMRQAFAGACDRLTGAGHSIRPAPAPVSFAQVIDDHRTIMLAEAARDLLPRIGADRSGLPPLLAAALAEGAMIRPSDVTAAERRIAEARARFWAAFQGVDLILACPTPGPAPAGFKTTGDQSYLTPWTTLGGPLTAIPSGLDAAGLPLGLLLAAAPGQDGALIGRSAAVADLLPRLPRPALPAAG